jgi:hypothetical protein
MNLRKSCALSNDSAAIRWKLGQFGSQRAFLDAARQALPTRTASSVYNRYMLLQKRLGKQRQAVHSAPREADAPEGAGDREDDAGQAPAGEDEEEPDDDEQEAVVTGEKRVVRGLGFAYSQEEDDILTNFINRCGHVAEAVAPSFSL